MDLTTLHWHTTRLLLAACAADPASPATESLRRALFLKLLDHTWRPTPTTSPIPFAKVEAWLAGLHGERQAVSMALAIIRGGLPMQADPMCPVCRILDAAQGQQIDIAIDLLRRAGKMRCRCVGNTHHILLAHPHTELGCVGYGKGV